MVPVQIERLDALDQQLRSHERRFAWLDSAQQSLMVLLMNGAALIVLIVAVPRIDGILLATVALIMTAAFEALTPLGLVTAHLGADAAAGQRLFEVMDGIPPVLEPVTPASFPESTDLEFRHIMFRYAPDEPPVLNDFSLHIRAGERIAVLGESGVGKSSLVNLLLRFWDVDSGQITMGGVELRTLSQEELRTHFGVMSQRVTLFNTTILENIRIGRSSATDAEVIEACHKAQLVPFIEKLPAGYETQVGELGTRLSGGEAQRIALARVLLKNAPIYILDEATANLDVFTERALLETILDVTAGKTLLLLTHRRVLLGRMDQVIELGHVI
jgi:ATP-binding cassette subfamily C protein CydC